MNNFDLPHKWRKFQQEKCHSAEPTETRSTLYQRKYEIKLVKNLPESLSSSSSSAQSILSAFVPCDSIVHCISIQIVRIVADNRINANIIFNSIFDGFIFPIIRLFIELNLQPIWSLALQFFALLIFLFIVRRRDNRSLYRCVGAGGLILFFFCRFVQWVSFFLLLAISYAHHSLLMHFTCFVDCTWGAICVWACLWPRYFQSLFNLWPMENLCCFFFRPSAGSFIRIYSFVFAHSLEIYFSLYMINTIGYDRF